MAFQEIPLLNHLTLHVEGQIELINGILHIDTQQ